LKIRLPYGKSRIELDLPEPGKVDIVKTPSVEPKESLESMVNKCLDNPISSRTLEELIRDKKGEEPLIVSIIIDDRTRACPDDLLVPILVKRLTNAGIKPENIKVIVATGLHAPPGEAEVRELSGAANLPEGVNFIGHDAVNSPMQSIGRVSDGYEVEINRHVAEADLKISTGFIEPHFFAGFSGGRKSLLPGVASKSTILSNHSFNNIGDENASTGLLKDNPVHEGATEAASLAGLDFVLNVVMNGEQEVVAAVAGNFTEALKAGVARDLEVCSVSLDRYYDVVITTNSGYPLDQDLYQTVKGMYTASLVAKPGAPILVASECSAGFGPENFYSLSSERSSPEAVLDYIEANGPMVAQWENQVMCGVLKKHEVYLKSSLPDEKVKDMMLYPVDDLQQFLRKLIGGLGKDQRALALPEGPFSLPYVRGSKLETRIKKYGE